MSPLIITDLCRRVEPEIPVYAAPSSAPAPLPLTMMYVLPSLRRLPSGFLPGPPQRLLRHELRKLDRRLSQESRLDSHMAYRRQSAAAMSRPADQALSYGKRSRVPPVQAKMRLLC